MFMQHSSRTHEMIRMSLKSMSKAVGSDEIIIAHPSSNDLSYLDGVFENSRFANDYSLKHIELSEYLPMLQFSGMYSGENRLENEIFFKNEESQIWDHMDLANFVKISSFYHKLKYFIIDPMEVDPTAFDIDDDRIERYFFHDLEDRKVTTSYFFLADQLPLPELKPNLSASYDNVFSMTAYSIERKQQLNRILLHNEYLLKFGNTMQLGYITTDITGKVDKGFEYSKYMEMLRDSKSTYILPSYDPKSVSLQRIIEALVNGSLPIFLFDNNLDVFNLEYPSFSFICKTLSPIGITDLFNLFENLSKDKTLQVQYFKDFNRSDLIQKLQNKNIIKEIQQIYEWK